MLPRGDVALRRCVAIIVAAAFVLIFGACSHAGSGRPSTAATLQILSPAPNAVTGPTVSLKVLLAHAKLVPPDQVGGRIQGDRGHIHISVDGSLYSMVLQDDDVVTDLAPGIHTIQAEFVASDHLPFRNRVVAAVTFRVS